MFILKDSTILLLTRYVKKEVAAIVGITPLKLRKMIKEKQPCAKQTAYCLTKFLNSEKEIYDFFDRKED